MKKVIVASANITKINAVTAGFKRIFKDEEFEVEGIAVESGVKDQPTSDQETRQGALNRQANIKHAKPGAEYYVAIEGGIEAKGDEMVAFAWAVVESADGKIGKGRTGEFFLPHKIVELINQGVELGEADDIVFDRKNSKHMNGAVGILTNDVLTRTSFYSYAVVLALIPFNNPDLY